ncbi:MAG: LysM peptidoglycan-binding domain-containing protein [Deltaproteobacteria bacterium]|nr:LysM peptidoglycan-binding domain-containing protein [Deltaproteobacteria bacterium]
MERVKIDSYEDVRSEENEENGQTLLDTALDFINASQEYWSEGNLEKAIATLDEAYPLVIKVDTDSSPELIQQKEDLRYTISRRILEIYASRYTAVNGNHNEIPLTMNENVDKEIKRFQGPERRFFIESYKRSGRYMPDILASLKEAGLPEDLAWLPLIESGFKVKALSRARALGLWQFIPSTGYKFGLKRDTWIDERLDPEKATAAAIAYLRELHKIFGDWTTVLAGYNCGEGTVLRKIRNQKINYLDNFWDLYQQLPYETARYVPRFLATLHILKDPARYGFTLDEPDSPLSYETVTIEKPVHLKAVAEKIGVALEELSDLNPELRHKATPAAQYALKIPAERKNVFLAHVHEIPEWTPPKSAYVYHRVRQGETLSVIALRYRTSVSRIVMANNIRKKHFIRVGQKLKIPLKGSPAGRTYASSEASLLPGGEYRVKKGDSLWLIAKKFKTNTKTIQQINALKDTRLRVGQLIKIEE